MALKYLHADLEWSGDSPRVGAVVLWDSATRAIGPAFDAVIEAKFAEVQKRTWPDWRMVPADQPIEHVRAAVEVQADAAATSPEAVAAEIAGQLTAWSETATAMVIVERLPSGESKTMPVRDLIAQWRERGVELEKLRGTVERLRADKSVVLVEETRKALGAAFGETAVAAATRVMDELETLRGELANSRACVAALNTALRATKETLGATDASLTAAEVAQQVGSAGTNWRASCGSTGARWSSGPRSATRHVISRRSPRRSRWTSPPSTRRAARSARSSVAVVRSRRPSRDGEGCSSR